MKALLALLVLLLVVGAYAVGYWPQRKRLVNVENELQNANAELAKAQARLRLFALQDRLLRLTDKIAEKNYGEAQGLSSDFFDQVRAEISRTDKKEEKEVLEAILASRDSVTASLARGESSVLELLQRVQMQLRGLLESSVGSAPAKIGYLQTYVEAWKKG